MKCHSVFVTCTLVASLFACNRSGPSGAATNDTISSDVQTDTMSDTQPPADADTAESTDAEATTTDAPDSAEPDVEPDVADTADAKPPWTPDITGASPFCEQQNVDLPVPGSPCTEEGKVRCTGAGAFDAADSTEPSGTRCVKPNRVTCQLVGGALQWVLSACGPLSPACDMWDPLDKYGDTGFFGAETMLCTENELGATCCPLDIADLSDPELPGWHARLCDPHAGETRCTAPFGGLQRCQFLNEAFDDPFREQAKFTTYATCLDSAAKCRYWYSPTVCPALYPRECAGLPPKEDGSPGPWAQVCIDLASEPARCAESCQDLKDASYPLPTK